MLSLACCSDQIVKFKAFRIEEYMEVRDCFVSRAGETRSTINEN